MSKQVRQAITPTHVLGSTGTAEGDDLGYRALADLKSDLALNNVDNTSDATKNSAVATLTNKTLVDPLGIEGDDITAAPRHSIRPSLLLDFANTKSLDPRITFARTSTGTYYDGRTVAKAEENLLTYSQDFTQWGENNASVTANDTTAPDGTTTADLIQATGTDVAIANKIPTPVVAVGVACISSFYAKAGTADIVYLREFLSGVSGRVTYFDLNTGSVGTTASGHTASIEDVFGDGSWYRCIVRFTSSVSTQAWQIGVADADGSTSVTVGANLHIWGAQFEQRSSVTAYTPTTTQPITNYIPVLQTAAAGEARFDHDPVTGESKGLLIEEQRTNLLQRSEEFDNAAWTKTNSTVESNVIVAPDGTLTGDKISEDTTASASHELYNTSGVLPSVGQTYTWSIYAKSAERTILVLGAYTGGTTYFSYFNLATGVVGTNASGNTATITPVGNGWYKCSVTRVAGTSGAFLYAGIAQADGTRAYTGDGYSGIYIWGAQLEAGAFPTSYIKTTSAQATRNADSASMTGTGAIGEGTAYVQAQTQSGDNLIDMGQTTIDAPDANSNKIAVGYDATSTKTSTNGGAVASTAGTQGGTDIDILDGATGTAKKVAVYPKKLTDAELQALTEA